MTAPNTLTATELAQRMDAGTMTAEAIVRAHLERIDQRDAEVLAWSHLAREAALERARVLDRGPRQGLLHGIPMGVKDIIDSARPADDLRLADLHGRTSRWPTPRPSPWRGPRARSCSARR